MISLDIGLNLRSLQSSFERVGGLLEILSHLTSPGVRVVRKQNFDVNLQPTEEEQPPPPAGPWCQRSAIAIFYSSPLELQRQLIYTAMAIACS